MNLSPITTRAQSITVLWDLLSQFAQSSLSGHGYDPLEKEAVLSFETDATMLRWGWYGRQGLETGTTQRKLSVYPVAGWERTRGEQLSACERFKRFSVFCLRRRLCAGGPHFCSSEQRSQPILRASSRTLQKKMLEHRQLRQTAFPTAHYCHLKQTCVRLSGRKVLSPSGFCRSRFSCNRNRVCQPRAGRLRKGQGLT